MDTTYSCYINERIDVHILPKDFSNDTKTVDIFIPSGSSNWIDIEKNSKTFETKMTITPYL